MAHPHAPGKLNPAEIVQNNRPYFMDGKNENRFFKSGYTGYLPRSRDYFAVGLTTMSSSGDSLFFNLTSTVLDPFAHLHISKYVALKALLGVCAFF